MNKINKFKEFLEKRKVLEAYKANFDADLVKGKFSPEETIIVGLKEMEPLNFLSGSFVWVASPEGQRFWHKLNNEWIKELV